MTLKYVKKIHLNLYLLNIHNEWGKTTNYKEIDTNFCSYFTHIGPKYANEIPKPRNNSSYHLHNSRSRNPHSLL